MRSGTLGPVPSDCRLRLVAHYGSQISGWLDAVPGLLEQVAERWKLTPGKYHDVGHASVVATARSCDGRRLLLKAWADSVRFSNEITALRLWVDGPSVDVVEAADDLAVAALEMVGGCPGGLDGPPHELRIVAGAIRGLHTLGRRRTSPRVLPSLNAYLCHEVRPRVRRRLASTGDGPVRGLMEAALLDLMALEEDSDRATVLHADLYRENVIFDELGRPRLIDPLPMRGDAAFDWAFWTVYYDLGRRMDARLATAARTSRIPVPVLAPWCRALALDGLLFYLDNSDPRAQRMADVLARLSAPTARNRS